MRHAEALPGGGGIPDEKRPLSYFGKEEAKTMAQELLRRQEKIELLLTSPYLRTCQTAAILEAEGLVGKVETCIPLASRGSAPQIRPLREKYANVASVLLLGHQPDMGMLAAELSGQSLSFSPATIAAFSWPCVGACQFLWSLSPSDLQK